MIITTHQRDKNEHVKIEFTCQMCGARHTKNKSKYPVDICRKCLLGPCKFLQKAQTIYGDTYTYRLETYKHSQHVMEMVCSSHGVFYKRPSDHLQGQGCPQCSKDLKDAALRKSHQQFIAQVHKIYGDNIDLSKVVYTGPNTPVIVVCPEHGDQETLPRNLLAGYAPCKQCLPGYVDTATFIRRAQAVHGNTYLYDQTLYTDARTPVTIICQTHGEFSQNPFGHLYGRGCSKCAVHGFNPGKAGYLYYLYLPEIDAYKIGITNHGIEARYLSYEREHFHVVTIKYFKEGRRAKNLEQWIINRYRKFRYVGVNPLNSGSTEIFCKDILGLNNSELL